MTSLESSVVYVTSLETSVVYVTSLEASVVYVTSLETSVVPTFPGVNNTQSFLDNRCPTSEDYNGHLSISRTNPVKKTRPMDS